MRLARRGRQGSFVCIASGRTTRHDKYANDDQTSLAPRLQHTLVPFLFTATRPRSTLVHGLRSR